MRIFDRYVLTEYLKPFFVGVSSFAIVVLSTQLFWLMELIMVNNVPASSVLKLVFYMLPASIAEAFPLAAMFAVLFAFITMVRTNELSVMQAAGVKFIRIALPVVIASVFLSFGLFALKEHVVPWANTKTEDIMTKEVYKSVAPKISSQVFFRTPDDMYIYIREVENSGERLIGVTIIETLFRDYPRVISAQEGIAVDGYIKLYNGSIVELDEYGNVKTNSSFGELEVDMDMTKLDRYIGVSEGPEQMNMSSLKKYIEAMRAGGVDAKYFEVDYYLKTSSPFVLFIMVLFSLALVPKTSRKKNIGLSIASGCLVAVMYYVLQATASSLGKNGVLSPFFSAWITNVIFLLAGSFLLYRRCSVKKEAYKRTAKIVLVVILLLLGLKTFEMRTEAGEKDVVIRGNRVEFESHTNLLNISGGVEIESDDITISSERALISFENQRAIVSGNVVMPSEFGTLKSDLIEIELQDDMIRVLNADVALESTDISGEVYLKSTKIDFEQNSVVLLKTMLTTCDLDEPHYRIEADEVEIYMGDCIIFLNVRYYEGKTRIFTMKRLVIPLYDDRGLQFPEVGYSDREGFYLKLKYGYYLNNNSYGNFIYNVYTNFGPELGFSHDLVINKNTKLNLTNLYTFDILREDLYPYLSMDIDIKSMFDLNIYARYQENERNEKTLDIGSDMSKMTNTTFFSASILYKKSQGLKTIESTIGRLGYRNVIKDDLVLSLNINYRCFDINRTNYQNVLNYEAGLVKEYSSSYLSLLVKDEVYIEDLSIPEENMPLKPVWKGLSALPELKYEGVDSTSIEGLNLAHKLTAGKYIETLWTNQTVEALKLSIEYKAYTGKMEITDNLSYSSSIGCFLRKYSTGDTNYGYSSYSSISLNLFKVFDISFSYDFVSTFGASVFYFDRIKDVNKLGASLHIGLNDLNIYLSGGYNLIARGFDKSTITFLLSGNKGVSLSVSADFDLNNMTIGIIRGAFTVSADSPLSLDLGVEYDFLSQQFSQIDFSGDLKLFWDMKLAWDIGYREANSYLYKGQIVLTKDLHCREISVGYDFVNKKVALNFAIKAFPNNTLSIGNF